MNVKLIIGIIGIVLLLVGIAIAIWFHLTLGLVLAAIGLLTAVISLILWFRTRAKKRGKKIRKSIKGKFHPRMKRDLGEDIRGLQGFASNLKEGGLPQQTGTRSALTGAVVGGVLGPNPLITGAVGRYVGSRSEKKRKEEEMRQAQLQALQMQSQPMPEPPVA